eukprot:1224530-Ditylum_brightwellii.AAC.1
MKERAETECFSMDIVELDKEHCSCVCGSGSEEGKDVVESAAAGAMAAVVATSLLVNSNVGGWRS